MNKQKAIAQWKQLKEAARECKLVAEHNISTATRLETLADSALEELGSSSGRDRKVKYQLTEDMQLKLKAALFKGKAQVHTN